MYFRRNVITYGGALYRKACIRGLFIDAFRCTSPKAFMSFDISDRPSVRSNVAARIHLDEL